jgi:replicative DNA helicase
VSEHEEIRQPPNAIEVERALLGALMSDANALPLVRASLAADDFYRKAHQQIYEAICELHDADKPYDVVLVSNRLRDTNNLVALGGRQYLTDLALTCWTSALAPHYAETVRDVARLRRIQNAARKAAELAYDAESSRPILDELAEQLEQMRADANQERRSTRLRDIAAKVFEDISMRFDQKEPPGIPTGWAAIDKYLIGWQPGDLIVVAARPSMGKTSLCLGALWNAATKPTNKRAFSSALFSLEMSEDMIVQRLLSTMTGIDSQRLMRATDLTAADFQALACALGDLDAMPIDIISGNVEDALSIESKLRQMKAEGKLPDLVVIDYLQLMSDAATAESSNRTIEISAITRRLKKLAQELGIAIILLSQLNRAVEQRQNKRPMLSDLRESGSIEQDSDVVIFIYRDDYYNAESLDRGIAELIIAKNRCGPTGTAYLKFNRETNKFFDLDTGFVPASKQNGDGAGSRYKPKGFGYTPRGEDEK